MKLAPKLILIFIVYAAALLAIVGVLAYNSGRDSLRSAVISELDAGAIEKQAALNEWVEGKQLGIALLAADPATIESAAALIAAPPGSPEAKAAHDRLVAEIRPRVSGGEFLALLVIDPQTGQVIAATDPGEEGKFKEDRLFFLNGKTGPYVQDLYYSLALQSPAMTAAAPLRAPDGRLLGVLAGRLDLEEMNAIINRRTGLRQTDDAYLVNTASLFVTQPRLIADPAVLQRGVHTEAVRRCLERDSGVVEAEDYRNVPTIAVYGWLPERGLCLIVKMDQAEAYGPARAFGGTVVAISALALLVATVLAVTLSRSLTRPILALQAGAARFGQGELALRLPETSRDELGELARAFNKMAEALAEQQTYLRRRAEQFFNLTLDLLCTASPAGQLMDLNPAWEHTLGYRREELKGLPVTDLIHPDDAAAVTKAFQNVAQDSAAVRFESRCRHKDGNYRWLAWVIVMSSQDKLLYAAARDVTERRLAEEALRQQAEELARSNRELEQFAYVASHDLQEPLRMVSSYVQLLARRYQGQLDGDADEFIAFAVEGANRMKTLINDLLAYSRVGTRGNELAPVPMEEICDRALGSLQLAIEDSGATVTRDPLPQVLADDVQMTQLLQNLIGNALKFRSQAPPRVHVGARRQGDHWLFFVRDNGIGLDPQYNERIFIIFQRLHNRGEYPGTGIGLAICRKIMERHGGRIWVESEPSKGATFYFTLRPAPAGSLPPDAARPRARDLVADRATDLI